MESKGSILIAERLKEAVAFGPGEKIVTSFPGLSTEGKLGMYVQ